MKIGEISKKTNIPIYSIRYYIKTGLIIPNSKNKQWYFSEKDLNELKLISKLKDLQFSLNDIHEILSLERTGNLQDPADHNSYMEVYIQHYKALLEQKTQLEQTITAVKKHIDSIQLQSKPHKKTGIPLSMMHLIQCPHCNQPLMLKNAVIQNCYLIDGDFWCECGYEAYAKNGILCTYGGYISNYNWPDFQRSFTKGTPVLYKNMLHKAHLFIMDKLLSIDSKNKIIYEDHINIHTFIDILMKEHPINAKFIISDYYYPIVEMYKERLERLNLNIDILYISDATLMPPLAKQCIDIFIDSHSSSEFMCFNKHHLLDILDCYLKPDCLVIGSALEYKNTFPNSKKKMKTIYPEMDDAVLNFQKCRKYFLQSKRYQELDIKDCGYITDFKNNEAFSYHITGEEMFCTAYFWQRNPKIATLSYKDIIKK